jgi:hypothetical protein
VNEVDFNLKHHAKVRLSFIKRKGKVVSVLLIEHRSMKAYWGNGDIELRFLDLGTRWEWSASRPDLFTPRETAPCTHWIGGLVGPTAGVDAVVRRKIPSPYRDSNPPSSSP